MAQTPDAEAPRDFVKQLIRFLSGPDYEQLKRDKLLRAMQVPANERDAAQETIKRLLRDGVIVELKRKGIALAESADLVSGRISFIRSGAAYVMDTAGHEYFVQGGDTGTALPGDRVLLRLNRGPERPGKKREGVVIRVVDRQSVTVVGALRRGRRSWFVEPIKSSVKHDVLVPDPAGANVGDRVLVKLDEWDDPKLAPEGEIIEVIGPEDDPALDTLAVIRANNLPTSFPPDVIAEAEGATIDADAEAASRRDVRSLYIVTIDPARAKDYDDGLSLERDGENWRLGVHIADVSHYVRPGSALDEEARRRGTSVYLPDQVLPMLPEQLSNGLCSLGPNRDRLAFSAWLTVSDAGELLASSFETTVIHSKVRLTYGQALAALGVADGQSLPDARLGKDGVHMLKQIDVLAQKLRRRRLDAGALFLEMPDVRFVIGADGRIEDIQKEDSDQAHQMVEECMLLANEAVCRELARRQVPLLRRIHEDPDPDRLQELAEQFRLAGVRIGDPTDRKHLAKVLRDMEGQPYAHPLYVATLRSMKRAAYDTQPIGHYGLAKTFYTHFTSPIRRYPDLLVHRCLKAALAGRPSPYSTGELTDLGRHCTDRETVAMEAEREIISLKTMRFFAEQLESGDIRDYDAVVTDVRNFGVFVDLPAVQCSGLIHVSQLTDDFFDFDAGRVELRGRRTGRVFRVGSQLKVVVSRVNSSERQLDFTLVTGE